MSGPFFYLPPEAWGREVSLEGQEAKHLGQVLRLVPGDEVSLLDGQGRTGRFAVRAVSKKSARLECLRESFTPRPASLAVMALAFSKAVRRGFFMEKAVELGAHAVWLWQATTARQTAGRRARFLSGADDRRRQAERQPLAARKCGL